MQMSKKIYHNKAIWSKKIEKYYIVAEITGCVLINCWLREEI